MTTNQPKKSNEDLTVRLTIDGVTHAFRVGDFNAIEMRLFRREMGVSMAKVFREGDFDLDVAAALLWISQRRSRPDLTYEQVAGDLTYDKLQQANQAAAEVEAGDVVEVDPEASGVG